MSSVPTTEMIRLIPNTTEGFLSSISIFSPSGALWK